MSNRAHHIPKPAPPAPVSEPSDDDPADMMAAYKSQYNDGDSDADDEFERSIMPSPTLPPDDFSPTDSEGMTSSEHTPTTYTHSHSAHSSPKGLITQWTAEMCADWIAGLGLSQYAGSFIGTLHLRVDHHATTDTLFLRR